MFRLALGSEAKSDVFGLIALQILRVRSCGPGSHCIHARSLFYMGHREISLQSDSVTQLTE